MQSIIDALHEQLTQLKDAKKKNFGSIPEDFKEMIETLLAQDGPAQYLLVGAAMAAQGFPDFIADLKKNVFNGAGKEHQIGDGIAFALDPSKISAARLIRDNWDLCENTFRMLYLGIRMGRAMERDEHDALDKIARMEANPNAFDQIRPVTQQAIADTPLSPEKEQLFRDELNEALRNQRKGGDKPTN